MPSSVLHFDTVNSTYVKNTTTTMSTTNDHPFNTVFKLQNPIRNVSRISLKSVEIPVLFPNIRTGSTDTFQFIYSRYANNSDSSSITSKTYTITLSETNYTSIATLVADINTAIIATGIPYVYNAGYTAVYLTVETSGLIKIWSWGNEFKLVQTNLTKNILGIHTGDGTGYPNFYHATSFDPGYIEILGKSNLNPDNYVNMIINNTGTSSTNASTIPCSFKIPLNATNGYVYFWGENASFTQWIEPAQGTILSNFTVQIKDRFNNEINPYLGDYSFTLRIDSS